jgi:hypothetical protein
MIHIMLKDSEIVRREIQRFGEALKPLDLEIVRQLEDHSAGAIELVIQRGHRTSPAIIVTLASDWFKDDLISFRIEYREFS